MPIIIMKNNAIRTSSVFYRIILAASVIILVLPLLALQPYFFPPDWAKVIVFRMVLAILLFFLLVQFILQKKYFELRPLNLKSGKSLAFWLLIALAVVYFIATVFSIDPHFSFWGSPYRSGGSLNFGFFILFSILLFLLVKDKEWQKIWDFSFAVGILVALIGICQYFGFFSKILISFEGGGTPSTTGYTGFFGTYLMLLSFMALSFGIKEKSKKRFFYFFCLPFFLLGIITSGARAVYLGFIFGLIYYLFFYPKKIKILKIGIALILAATVIVILYINFTPQLPPFFKTNKILSYFSNRLSLKNVAIDLIETRLPAWKIGLKAVKDKPLLGWGPENYQSGYDYEYTASSPKMLFIWWDRAHNFLIEYGINAGIPFVIIYLLFIAVLFWQLQKTKKGSEQILQNSSIVSHAIQSAFLGYLVNNFFTFDGFVTYFLFFLLVGYSLFLINKNSQTQNNQTLTAKKVLPKTGQKTLLVILFVILVWFLWSFNLWPLYINSRIVTAQTLVWQKEFVPALAIMEKIMPKKSILDVYLRLRYLEFIDKGAAAAENPDTDKEYAQKGLIALKEAVKIQPSYTRTWLLLGGYTNVLINHETDPQIKKELSKEAYSYLETGQKLSPNRPEFLVERAKTDFLMHDYQAMKEEMEKCVKIAPDMGDCYWFLGIGQIIAGEEKEGEQSLATAKYQGHIMSSFARLNQLATAYSIVKDYEKLAETYEEIILNYARKNLSYHASLAFTYLQLNRHHDAYLEALKAFYLSPEEMKEETNEFLKLVNYRPERPTDFDYHFSLAKKYIWEGGPQEYKPAEEEMLVAFYISPEKKQEIDDLFQIIQRF